MKKENLLTYLEQSELLHNAMNIFSVNIEQVYRLYRQVFDLIRLNSFKYEPSKMKPIISAATNFEDFLESIKLQEEFPLKESDIVIMHSLFFITDIGADLRIQLNENIATHKTHATLRNFVDIYLEKTGLESPEPFCFSLYYSKKYQQKLLLRFIEYPSSFLVTLQFLSNKIYHCAESIQSLIYYVEDREHKSPALSLKDLDILKSSIAYLTLSGSLNGEEGEEHLKNLKTILTFANSI